MSWCEAAWYTRYAIELPPPGRSLQRSSGTTSRTLCTKRERTPSCSVTIHWRRSMPATLPRSAEAWMGMVPERVRDVGGRRHVDVLFGDPEAVIEQRGQHRVRPSDGGEEPIGTPRPRERE